MESPAYPVVGVGNVLDLLLFLEERQRVKVSDVSTELNIAASTAHRLLSMFKNYGFVQQEECSHAYCVGPGLVTFSASIAAKSRTLDLVRPVLRALVDDSNETVHLAMLNGSSVVYVDCVESRKTERARSRTGRAMPAYATASGKAILAELGAPQIEHLFPSESLARITPHTLKTRDALVQDLCKTRERGFAFHENESQLGFFAYACPIRTSNAVPAWALVVAGPSRRFRKSGHKLADLVCGSAEVAAGMM